MTHTLTIKAKIEKNKQVIYTIIIALLYMVYWPYEATGNDMIEIIPTLKKIHHPELYPADFYLNFVHGLQVYERSFFLYFLYFLGGLTPILLKTYYLICLAVFILGLFRLFEFFIEDFFFQMIGILVVLFALKYSSIGANELFYSMPTSAIFAKTLCVWSFYFTVTGKKNFSYALLLLATYFHILVGLQVFIILAVVDLISHYRKSGIVRLFTPLVIYCLLIIPYVLALLLSRKEPHTHDNNLVDLLEFRIGHHFFLQYNSLGSILLYCILFFLGLFLWSKENKYITKFYLIQALLLTVYLVFGNLFRNEFILQFQWLKTTIWIELFTVIILVKQTAKSSYFEFNYKQKIILTTLVIVGILFMTQFTTKENSDLVQEEIQLAQWAKRNTVINSLFVYTPYFTRFKNLSERSSWVDYKAIVHQKAYLIPWFDRIQRIFKINLNDRRNGNNLVQLANANFEKITEGDLLYLFDDQNVDYIILPTQLFNSAIISPAYSTAHFTVYQRIKVY